MHAKTSTSEPIPAFFFSSERSTDLFVDLWLCLGIAAVYLHVLQYPFIRFDDPLYITENPYVQSGLSWSGIRWAFTNVSAGFWMPVTWLSFLCDYELYGLNPAGYHLTNILLHMGNSLLLYRVLRLMTGTVWRSALVACLFALHPLRVESVVWISERKDVLSTFFWMCTLLAYYYYVARKGAMRYMAAMCTFILGLMAKPMIVTLPFVLLLLDYWPLGRYHSLTQRKHKAKNIFFGLVTEKIPFFIVSAIFSALTYTVHTMAGLVISFGALTLDLRLANALLSYLVYIKKMLWPFDLGIFYPHPGAIELKEIIPTALVLGLFTFIAIRFFRKCPYWVVGWFWFLGTLLPAIGIVQMGFQASADRYSYIPLIGLFILIAWSVPIISARPPWKRPLIVVLGLGVIIGLSIRTWDQTLHWRSTLSLFTHTLSVTEDNWLMHHNLGILLSEKRRPLEAASHFTQALEIKPYYENGMHAVSLAMSPVRNDSFIHHAPFAPKPATGSIQDDYRVSQQYLLAGKFDQAIRLLRKALLSDPVSPATHNNLGVAHLRKGHIPEAMAHFTFALKYRLEFPEAHYNLGKAYDTLGYNSQALLHYEKAFLLRPDYKRARDAVERARKEGDVRNNAAH